MTLLSTIQDAAEQLGIPSPTGVFESTDPQVAQLKQLLKSEGKMLLKEHDWQGLITTRSYTAPATTAQTGEPQSDFDRMMNGCQVWNETSDWEIVGPISANEWATIVVRDITTLPQYWRLEGGVLQVYDSSSGDTHRYEYISKNWIYESGSTPGDDFTDDTDTFAFDEHLLTLGVVWRFLRAKGLDYAEALMDYNRYKVQVINDDKGASARYTSRTPKNNDLAHKRTWPGTISTS